MADWLLNVGRPSNSAVAGDGVGEGVAPSGVVEGVDAGVAVGVDSGVAVGVDAGVGVGVDSGVGVGVGCGVGVDVDSGVGVARGDSVAAEVAAGVAVGEEDGEFEGCPPEGAAGCCSHPKRRMPARTEATTRLLFIPINTDARAGRIFKAGCNGLVIQAFCTNRRSPAHQRDKSVWVRMLNPSPAKTDQPHS